MPVLAALRANVGIGIFDKVPSSVPMASPDKVTHQDDDLPPFFEGFKRDPNLNLHWPLLVGGRRASVFCFHPLKKASSRFSLSNSCQQWPRMANNLTLFLGGKPLDFWRHHNDTDDNSSISVGSFV